jgi:diguanylate cyclase (GGDEF)-like protein
MGWFSKRSDGQGTHEDAAVLRDAFVALLGHIEGELPRSEARRVRELIERLTAFPVPTGVGRQTTAMIKAMRGTAVGVGSADFADAARALVGAMQRVSIHDRELTEEIDKLEHSVPSRVRHGDARSIEVNAKAIDKSAQAARFRRAREDEAVFSLIDTLEANLGKALQASAGLDQDLIQLRVLVEGLSDPASFGDQKEVVLTAIQRLEDGGAIARARVDQGVARVRELGHQIRSQRGSGAVGEVRVSIDGLTQVADRNAFLDALPLALVGARHSDGMLTCMRVNIDGMNDVNETYHQSSGDDVLRTVAATIVQQLRTEDFVARLGSDDFAALLPEAGTREATTAAKRLGRKVAKMVFTHQAQTFRVSISIGLATWDGKESSESLYARAEAAMHQAKKNGGAQYWAAQTLQQP